MSTSFQLRNEAAAIWTAQLEHPLVLGIGDGTLDPGKFAFWLRQDYLFLIDYSRALACAALRAPDLATMTAFANLLSETVTTEMDLHRSYVSEFGITEVDLEQEPTHPTTRAYTNFLLRVASTGSYPDLVAALLPCMWGYSDVGQTLQSRGMPDDGRYAQWIAMYAAPEFADLAGWCRTLLDSLTDGVPSEGLTSVKAAFLTSCQYELDFWEMAWSAPL
ncbi:thiaminase II [soil metagenome]